MFFARFAPAFPSIAPPIPEITYGSLTGGGTQITATIDNFSSDFSYVATTNVGTLSRTGANITVTGLTINTSVNIVVIATSARGLSTPSSAVTDRQPYTFRTETRTGTRVVDTTSCYPASPGPSCPFGGVLNIAGTECCVASSYTEEFTFTVEVLNPAPTGYLDSGFDWYRVSNVSIERIPYTYYTETYTYQYSCPGTCCVDLPYDVTVCDTCVREICETICYGNCTNYGWGEACGGFPGCYCPGCSVGDPCCYGTSCRYENYSCNCRTESRCCNTYCSPCTVTCTGTGTRQVRNPTPSGYTDSGVDWYRFI